MIKKILKNKQIGLIITLGFILRFYKIKERFYLGMEASKALWWITDVFRLKN